MSRDEKAGGEGAAAPDPRNRGGAKRVDNRLESMLQPGRSMGSGKSCAAHRPVLRAFIVVRFHPAYRDALTTRFLAAAARFQAQDHLILSGRLDAHGDKADIKPQMAVAGVWLGAADGRGRLAACQAQAQRRQARDKQKGSQVIAFRLHDGLSIS